MRTPMSNGCGSGNVGEDVLWKRILPAHLLCQSARYYRSWECAKKSATCHRRWSLTKWSVSFYLVKLETHLQLGKHSRHADALPEPLGRGSLFLTHTKEDSGNMKWKKNKSTEMNWSIIDCILWTRCTSILTIKAKHSRNFVYLPTLADFSTFVLFFIFFKWCEFWV